MPNYTQYGDQEYVFGFSDNDAATIATSVGLKPQTLSVNGEPEFTAEGKNVDGMTEAFVVGDRKFTFTMNGFIVDETLFDGTGQTFTYKGNFYIVTSTKRDVSNADFQKGEVTGVSYQLIDS